MAISDDDDILLADLARAVAERDLVTDRAREAARAAFAWRTIDEELMALTYDSTLADELLVRGADTARVIGFRGQDLELEVELDTGQLTGQVLPGREADVSVVRRDGEPLVVRTDASGFFTVPFDAAGPVRFTVSVEGVVQSTVWISF